MSACVHGSFIDYYKMITSPLNPPSSCKMAKREGADKMREIFDYHFENIEDARCQCDIDYPLTDVLIQIMFAVMCGLDEPEKIVEFGKTRLEFLRKHFRISKTPSESTISRILNMTDAKQVGACIISIMRELLGQKGDVIAIDGKTICSAEKYSKSKQAIHIITAYMTTNGVTLGQMTVPEKTNEIPVLRDLLEFIDIKGKTITADAMHCQKDTADAIVNRGGDYILGVKSNQKNLHDDISVFFEDGIKNNVGLFDFYRTAEQNGGRIEIRKCYVSTNISWLLERNEGWASIQAIVAVVRETTKNDKKTVETSYYISSKTSDAKTLLQAIRDHWKIESLHWQLDVIFSEDDCAVVSENGQVTLNIFRKYALAMHKHYIASTCKKVSMRKNMFRCLLNEAFLLEVLSCPL